ncbi:hypothetical protein D4R51_02975 [bacterium]|nr:MAG: hypothetical protein D4R51_02975 [bacterium]
MLFGHEEKVKIFKKLIKEEKLGQAYLFYGDRGIGKNAFAVLLAHALETGKFSAEGGPASGGETGAAPLLDALFLAKDPEENKLGKEKISEVKKFLWQKPVKSLHKLVILDNTEDLTPEAQGALLKIVEEPPAHALLIFIAQDDQVFLPPLLSRLTKVYFPRLSKAEVANFLSEKYEIKRDKAEEIAERSFGRLGLALNILNKTAELDEKILEDFLESRILKLRRENLKKNALILTWLLERETLVKRYNLNTNLQRKAAEQILTDRNGY